MQWRANASHYLGQASFNLTGDGVAKKGGYPLDLGRTKPIKPDTKPVLPNSKEAAKFPKKKKKKLVPDDFD